MAGPTTRIVQWKEQKVAVREIPMDGLSDDAQKQCEDSFALVFAGHGRTNAGGSWTVLLPAVSCLKPAPDGTQRPSVTATPTTEGMTEDIPRPYIMVVRAAGPRVTIWSFDTNGQLAPNVEFSWHCIVEGTFVGQ